jgi:hypothetical protein
VVLAHGAQQELHPQFFEWFPKLIDYKQKVLTSDYFLQKEGFLHTMKRFQTEPIKKIVIIGGSHSGFSAAWMMLNGPADLWHNT